MSLPKSQQTKIVAQPTTEAELPHPFTHAFSALRCVCAVITLISIDINEPTGVNGICVNALLFYPHKTKPQFFKTHRFLFALIKYSIHFLIWINLILLILKHVQMWQRTKI